MTARLRLVSDNSDNPQLRDEPVDLYEQLRSVPEPDNNGRLIGLACMALSAFIVVYFTFELVRAP